MRLLTSPVARAVLAMSFAANLALPSPAAAEGVEPPGGLSPPGAPKTVHDPLESHGSRCSAVSMT